MPLRRFFLNTWIFGPRGFSFDNRDDLRVRDEGRPGEDLAAVVSTSSTLFDRQLLTGSPTVPSTVTKPPESPWSDGRGSG
jgi:hypothetical protein